MSHFLLIGYARTSRELIASRTSSSEGGQPGAPPRRTRNIAEGRSCLWLAPPGHQHKLQAIRCAIAPRPRTDPLCSSSGSMTLAERNAASISENQHLFGDVFSPDATYRIPTACILVDFADTTDVSTLIFWLTPERNSLLQSGAEDRNRRRSCSPGRGRPR